MTTIRIPLPFPDDEKRQVPRNSATLADVDVYNRMLREYALVNNSTYEFEFKKSADGTLFEVLVGHRAEDGEFINRLELLPSAERSPQLVKQRLIELMTSDEYREMVDLTEPGLLYTKAFLENWFTVSRLTENSTTALSIEGQSSIDGQAERDFFHGNTRYVETQNPLAQFVIPTNQAFRLDPTQGDFENRIKESAMELGFFLQPNLKLPPFNNAPELLRNFDTQSDAYFFLNKTGEETVTAVETGGGRSTVRTVENKSLWTLIPMSLLKQDPRAAEAEAARGAAEEAERKQRELEEGALDAGLTEQQRKNRLPLNEQAILLYHLGELMGSNRLKRSVKEYDRFACVECENNEEIATMVNKLSSPLNLSPLFDRIRPVHLSAVIPRLRLFKQYHKNSKRMQGKEMNDPDEPRTLVEYEFEEYLDKSVLSETLSTNTGIGIESFSFNFNGTNQFEAERLIDANLKIKAQSVDALEKLRKGKSSSGKEYQYRFSDLFIPDITQKDDTGTRNSSRNQRDYITYEVKNFETRVCVEYTADRESPAFKNSLQDGELIANALDSLKLDINLVVSSHTIDLRDDGTLTVDINFIGRLDAYARDPGEGNILPHTRLSEVQLQKVLSDRDGALNELDELAAMKNIFQQNRASETDEDMKNDLDSEIKQIEEREVELRKKYGISKDAQINNLEDEDKFIANIENNLLPRKKLYRSILTKMIERELIYVAEVDPSDIAKKFDRYNPDLENTGGEMKDPKKVENANIPTGKDMKKLQTKPELENSFKQHADRMRKQIVPLFQDDAYYIRFFYFGDLVDIVLDNMHEGEYSCPLSPKRRRDFDLRTILGPIEIVRNVFDSNELEGSVALNTLGKLVVSSKYQSFDPAETRRAKKASQEAEKILNEGEDRRLAQDQGIRLEHVYASLADVPISLNLFLRWFADNISNKATFGYSLKKFIVDATQSLIVASLQADSTRILLPKQKRMIKTLTWDAHSTPTTPDAFGFVNRPGKGLQIELLKQQRGKDSKFTQISEIAKRITPRPLRSDPYMSDYAMVYAEAPRFNRTYEGRHEEYLRDLNDGVYHLSVGRDVGMVKDINLSAVSIPGYEEMQIQNALKDMKRPKKRIYEATVTMFGTTFFRPGQLVYIHAAAFGSLEDLKAFGLAGYYTVRTVSTHFSAGNFETQLVCDFNQGG